MFARVLKTTTSQYDSPNSSHLKSNATSAAPSPSKIPIPATPTHSSAKENAVPPSPSQERSGYLSFLFNQQAAAAPASPARAAAKDEDIHMQTVKNGGNGGAANGFGVPVHRKHVSEDVMMRTAKHEKQGPGLQLWERELLEKPEVKRAATVAQICKYQAVFWLKLTTQTSWTTTVGLTDLCMREMLIFSRSS